MEIFIVIGVLLLLATTGFYAWFSAQILKEIRQENSTYRTIIEKQLKLATLPHLYCDLKPSVQGLKLEVYNVGSVPAYDIHISTIGAYTEEGIDIPTFLRTYIQPRYRKLPLQADKVGYYGIRSSLRYPMLPVQKRLEVALSLPARPVDIYVLVQFREMQGANYFQVYCFSELDDKGGYRANLVDPVKSESLERQHLHDMDEAKLPEKAVPFSVRDFLELWNHSLSYRLTSLAIDEQAVPQEIQDV